MQYMFKSSISWSLSVIFNAVFGFFFFFFSLFPVSNLWRWSNGGGERERERERVRHQTFLGLEIGLECNK